MKKLTNKQLKNIYNTGAFTKSTKPVSVKYNVYFYLLSLLKGNKVHCYSYVFSGQRSKYKSISSAFLAAEFLKAAGYKVIMSNDAPRGGVMGTHFKLARHVNATAAAILEQINDAKNRGVL